MVVINPSTTTITSTRTLGFASTITDQNIPIFTLDSLSTSITSISDVAVAAGTFQPTAIITQTSIEGTYYFENPLGSITSTSLTGWLLGPTGVTYIVGDGDGEDSSSGFDSWSAGAKAGLIIGVVFAALMLLWLLMCCYKRNSRWIAHDWRWAPQVEGSAPGIANANMMAPGTISTPMTMVSTPAPAYSYGGYPGYAYMRGGGSNGSWYDRVADKFKQWRVGKKHDIEHPTEISTPIRVLRETRELSDQRRRAVADASAAR